MIVTGSFKKLKIWELSVNKCISTINAHNSWILDIIHIPKDRILTTSFDKTIKLWELTSCSCCRTYNGHTNSVWCLLLWEVKNTEKLLFLSGGADKSIRLWDINKSSSIKVLNGHTSDVVGIAKISEKLFASCSTDNTIRIWSFSNEKCLYSMSSHNDAVRSLVYFFPSLLVSCSDDKTLKVFDLNKKECIKTLRGHIHQVRCLKKINNSLVASGSFDSTIRIWDVTKFECLQILKGHSSNVYCLGLYKGLNIVSVSSDSSIKIWGYEKNNYVCKKTLKGHKDAIYSVCSLNEKNMDDIVDSNLLVAKQRLSFIKNPLFYNFEICFKNYSLKCFKSLLCLSELDLEKKQKIEFLDVEMSINSKVLLDLILGKEKDEIVGKNYGKYYYDLFVLFRSLKMRKHMFFICKKVEKIENVNVLLGIFFQCLNYFENYNFVKSSSCLREILDNEKSSEDFDLFSVNNPRMKYQFKCSFSLSIFNNLKKRYESILKNERIVCFLDEIDYLSRLHFHKIKPIENHKDFIDMEEIENEITVDSSFRVLYQKTLKHLFEKKMFFNITLVTENKKFYAHKEILIQRSNFFYQILKFKGAEHSQMKRDNTVIISLSSDELENLLRWVYGGVNCIFTSNARVLFKLFEHSTMYFQHDLSTFLQKKIDEVFEKSFKNNTFFFDVLKSGYIIKRLPTNLRERFLNLWSVSYKIQKEVILNIIDMKFQSSTEQIDLINQQREEINRLNLKIKEQESILKQKNKIIYEQRTQINTLKSITFQI